jgi:hypothetical protein
MDEHQKLLAKAWRPAETAPRDGSIIWLSDGCGVFLGFWLDGEQYEVHGSVAGGWRLLTHDGRRKDLHFAPTLWQSAPLSPGQIKGHKTTN